MAIVAVFQLGVVMAKTLFFCWVFVWVRWTLPRIRYDQIMSLGWKVLLNIALINLAVTAIIVKLIQEVSHGESGPAPTAHNCRAVVLR